GALIVALVLLLYWCGEWQLGTADILLAELHLGATYDAVARGRLWRHMPVEVVVVPLGILGITYALMYGGYPIVVATAAMYLAAWHRGRQNLGIARYYQFRVGGASSPWHGRLFQSAIYLPMVAGVAFFASTSPLHEDEEYIGLGLDPGVLWVLGVLAVASLVAYLAFTVRYRGCVHPGERWVVVANALAFGSAYVLGAWTVSFILVLALHHEVQYLSFAYAMARRSAANRTVDGAAELRLLASFMVWPVIGLATWAACKFSDLPWLAPFLVGGLLCHYWLDSRIWTARAWRLASR
ncbi:MAG TPA: hypothetical protein VFC14_18005, partial [Burkholderiales bacterium]|nr:hypothetical protein [Burkholderiales bacterium]